MQRGGVYVLVGILVILISSIFTPFLRAQAKTRVEVNIFYPGAAYNPSLVTGFQQSLGIQFTSTKWYQDWATNFDPSVANSFHNAGFIPELTWEPQLSGVGVSYNDVINGNYDSYITQTALSVKNLGYTIRISLAPEMNTDWTPWGIGKQGNTAESHKQFWQHVVNKFRDAGATNVKWIWSANVRPWNASTLYGSYSNIFPGSDYVDYLGLDGYNWGTSQSWSTWQSFRDVFQSSYNELAGVASKDILIMEISSAEAGGSKAQWISDMFSSLETSFPRIKGFTWFHINKETDWRINSSDSAKASFIAGYHGQATTAPQSNTTSSNSATTKTTTKTSTPNYNPSPVAQAEPTPSVQVESTSAEPKIEAPANLPEKLAGSLVASKFENFRTNLSLTDLTLILGVLANSVVLLIIFFNRLRHLQYKKKHYFFGLGLLDSIFTKSQLRLRQERFYRKIRGV